MRASVPHWSRRRRLAYLALLVSPLFTASCSSCGPHIECTAAPYSWDAGHGVDAAAGDLGLDAARDLGPPICPSTEMPCNVVTGRGCSATLACRLPVDPLDAGIDAETPDVCQAIGVLPAYAPCASSADCARGLFCLETVIGGVCRTYCCRDADCPGLERCRNDRGDGLGYCALPHECDTLTRVGCAIGRACHVIAPRQTACLPAGTLPEFAPCSSLSDCAAGLRCSEETTPACRRYCDVTDPTSCAGGHCERIDVDIGICIPTDS